MAHHDKFAEHSGVSEIHKILQKTYYLLLIAAEVASAVRDRLNCAKNWVRLLRWAKTLEKILAFEMLDSVATGILELLFKSLSFFISDWLWSG